MNKPKTKPRVTRKELVYQVRLALAKEAVKLKIVVEYDDRSPLATFLMQSEKYGSSKVATVNKTTLGHAMYSAKVSEWFNTMGDRVVEFTDVNTLLDAASRDDRKVTFDLLNRLLDLGWQSPDAPIWKLSNPIMGIAQDEAIDFIKSSESSLNPELLNESIQHAKNRIAKIHPDFPVDEQTLAVMLGEWLGLDEEWIQ